MVICGGNGRWREKGRARGRGWVEAKRDEEEKSEG